MEIRLLRRSDLNDLLRLYEHLHQTDDAVPEMAKVQAVWNELMESPHYLYFGGFVSETLVTCCNLTIIPNLTRGCRPYGLIENVVTHVSHRKQGYGLAILKAALSHAWSERCYKVMLLTGRKDESIFRFYESVGFNRHDKQAFIAKYPSKLASLVE